VFLLLVLAAGSWTATCGFAGCPSTADILAFRPSEGGRVLDRAGAPIGRLTYVRRVNVPLSRVPRHVRAAFIAVEDRRFYYHHGVDWRGAARALVRNISRGDVSEGFSTITMQVVRNAFVPRLAQERTLRRKLIEIRLAYRLERALTKQQILALYLNVIYLGNGAYGVEAASRDLFGKSVDRLTVAEGATLAALARGPSLYAPRRHPDRAVTRRNLVLTVMAREHYLSDTLAARARAEPLRLSPAEWRPREDRSFAIDPVRAAVDSLLGDDEQVGDLIVYTTLDGRAQRVAEAAVRRQADAIERSADRAGRDTLQGAFIALDPRNGELRAIVGGRRYVPGGFNRALTARRQPGSAFKPFVYAAALRAGMTPATLVDDEPVEVAQGRSIWRPANYEGNYIGTITLTKALAVSSNAAAVRVSQTVGIPSVIQAARRNGISSPLPSYPAIALGAVDVTPLELVAAYAPFANGGLRVHPRLVRRIEAADGTVLWSAEIAPADTVMDPRDAYQLTSMLRGVVDNGTARTIRDEGVRGPVAGKTGTTNNAADVWFVGYTPTLVAGVWFGYDTPREIAPHASGGHLAAPAWADFYLNGWREPASSADGWTPPPGMTMRLIDPGTGMLANQWCPIRKREYFKPGTEPTEVCNVHTEPVDQEAPWGTEAPPNQDPIQRGADGIGKILRKIFRF
jgi:1A family penicillin-binding protein